MASVIWPCNTWPYDRLLIRQKHLTMEKPKFISYEFNRRPSVEMQDRAESYLRDCESRRSVRHFSDEPVPRSLIETAIMTASTAPSGAHRQPWRFVATNDPEIKKRIRVAAEEEERISYEGGRMPDVWLEALRPLGTDWRKPFLETVPWIVVVFAEKHSHEIDGSIRRNYYVSESVGIACGLFIAALNNMGLCTLTHTPSPMKFLSEIMQRPSNEKPYILFPIGYPAASCEVPDIHRKPLGEVGVFLGGDRGEGVR